MTAGLEGSAGAILLGDLLLFKAIDLICRVADGRYTHDLVKLTGEVCEAESEQELILNGADSELDICQSKRDFVSQTFGGISRNIWVTGTWLAPGVRGTKM